MAFNSQFQVQENHREETIKIFPRYPFLVALLNVLHDLHVELDKPQETAVENFSQTIAEAVSALKEINGDLAGRLQGGFDGLLCSLRLQEYPTSEVKDAHQQIFSMLYNAYTAVNY